MTTPYEVGDQVVTFELGDDGAVRVYSARVVGGIVREDGGAVITTDRGGRCEVDSDGVGASLVPMDEELRGELTFRGEGFEAVEEGGILREPELEEPSLNEGIEGDGRGR